MNYSVFGEEGVNVFPGVPVSLECMGVTGPPGAVFGDVC